MSLEAVLDKVIVKPVEEVQETGGFQVMSDPNETIKKGVVVSSGQGPRNSEYSESMFKEGDLVLYPAEHAKFKYRHEGEEHIILSEDLILAVIR